MTSPNASNSIRQWTRRGFLRLCGAGAAAVACTGAYGATVEVDNLVVEHHDLPLPGLAAAWEGRRIVQLTDLHASEIVGPELLARAFALAAACEPAAICVTGDWVTDSADRFDDLAAAITPLDRRIPIVGVSGNHDLGHGPARGQLTDELERRLAPLGVRLLRNAWWQPVRGPGQLCIAGLDDLYGRTFDPTCLAHTPADAPTLLLVHNPDAFEFVAPYRWHAMLCGHTHGGQVCTPWGSVIHVPVRHRERARGFWNAGPGRIGYTARGVGHWLHIRLFCPPEVTCFTLRQA